MIKKIKNWIEARPNRVLPEDAREDKSGVYYRVACENQFFHWAENGFNVWTMSCLSPLYWSGSKMFGKWKRSNDISFPFHEMSEVENFAPLVKK